MAITATVNTTRTVVGSVSQGNQPQVTRVTVPGPKGDSGATGGKLVELADVDASSVQDGALIQYDANSEKFQITNRIETDTGEIRLNGGTF
jgi:hypothetical protein